MRLTKDGQSAGIAAPSVPFQTPNAAGVEAPTDLSLSATSSGFAPGNAPGPATIGRTMGDGVALPGVGVGLTPQVATPSTAGALSHDRVFYADASTDTDLIVGALPDGVQVLYQLRSPDSPTSFNLDLSMPPDAQAQLTADGSGAVDVMRGGKASSRVEMPLATDAQGQNVPVHYELSGNRITLRVDHTAGDYAYPILVDPVISYQDWHDYSDQGVYGWYFYTPWPDFFFPSTSGGWGNGLYTVLGAGRFYGNGTYGVWRYPLYGDSYVYDMTFGLQREQTNSPYQAVCTSWTLVNNPGGWDNAQYWIGDGGNSGTGPRTRCNGFDNMSSRAYTDMCLKSDCTAPSSHQPNYAEFETWAYGDSVRDGWNISHVGYATAYITDPEKPTITGGPFNDTVMTGESFAYTASDPGLGVYSVSFDSPGNPGWNRAQTRTNNCGGVAWSPCPSSVSNTVGYGNLPTGDQTIRMTVTDAGGKTSTSSWIAHVYPTSVQYGGGDRSVNTADEVAAVQDAAAADPESASAIETGLSPDDWVRVYGQDEDTDAAGTASDQDGYGESVTEDGPEATDASLPPQEGSPVPNCGRDTRERVTIFNNYRIKLSKVDTDGNGNRYYQYHVQFEVASPYKGYAARTYMRGYGIKPNGSFSNDWYNDSANRVSRGANWKPYYAHFRMRVQAGSELSVYAHTAFDLAIPFGAARITGIHLRRQNSACIAAVG